MTGLQMLRSGTLVLLAGSMGHAANLDVDNASASAYGGGWFVSSYTLDGTVASGAGFGGWNLRADPNAAVRIESVASLGGGTLLDTGSASFRLSGGWYEATPGNWTQAYAKAERWLDPAGLDVGQAFTFQMAVNYRNGAKGVDLFGIDGTKIFNFNVGGDNYVVGNATTGNGSIGNDYSNDTLLGFRFEQTNSAGGSWAITRSGGLSDLDSGTYTGVVRRFDFYAGGTDNNNPDALFFNNFAIIPEPSTGPLFVGGLLAVSCLRRRRCENPALYQKPLVNRWAAPC